MGGLLAIFSVVGCVAARILSPGAKILRQAPKLEYSARLSFSVIAPTVTAFKEPPGL